MKYYAYYRVSTQTQADNNGIGMQLNVIREYCEKNNITLDGEFKDEAVSGTIVERNGITELLAEIEKGDKIIVQNTSRLWRDEFATAIIKKEIMKAGADVLSIEQPRYSIYDVNPNDMLINGLFELLDRYDKMSISIKLAKGRKARANKGYKPCGATPYGYIWDKNEVKIDYNNHLIVVDIFENYIKLKSLEKLRLYCIEKGYKTARGNDFSKQSLKNMLDNDFYIGVMTYAEKKVSGNQPVFLDKTLFDKANAILGRRNIEKECIRDSKSN